MRYLLMIAALLLGNEDADKSRTAVHEWGTFTTVSGGDGGNLQWRPLNGPTDLPSFVYKMARDGRIPGKWEYMTTVRMETPVLYFYAPKSTEFSVKVDFPNGVITEWYPKATLARSAIDWGRVRVEPGTPEAFLREKAESHYYPARETDAAPLRVKEEREKLLFYRGVGWFPTPLRIQVKGDQVHIMNTEKPAVPSAILFENRGGAVGFRLLGAVDRDLKVARPELTSTKADAMRELEKVLLGAGLYPKEAAAMIKTWSDAWFEEGLRVFSLVPRETIDAILPLKLDPKPDDLVRVFVARAELITPEMDEKALALVQRHGKDVPAVYKEAAVFGRFAEPIVQRAYALQPKQ